MSMYVDILSSTLDAWVDERTGSALIDHVLACRARMLPNGEPAADSAHVVLAESISYDRALINLCTELGIDVVPSDFARPQEERGRLERELRSAGVDLAALAARRENLQG
jgi:hypothetical protein